jgi:hypothetical protein
VATQFVLVLVLLAFARGQRGAAAERVATLALYLCAACLLVDLFYFLPRLGMPNLMPSYDQHAARLIQFGTMSLFLGH